MITTRLLLYVAPLFLAPALLLACGTDGGPSDEETPIKPDPPAASECLLDAPLGATGAYDGPPLATLFPGVDAPVSADEQRLYDLLMAERTQRGLPVIPLSPALTTVARAHALDATAHYEDPANNPCNLHSWSNQGPWDGCCYTADHAEAACMWDKPRQLTRYRGDGFEISAWGSLDAKGAVELWMNSPGHRSVLLNEAGWKTQRWEAIGVGIEGAFFNVWFGRCPDYTVAR